MSVNGPSPPFPDPSTGTCASGPIDVAMFRASQPEFADATAYPDATVQMYLDVANLNLPCDRWGTYWTIGVCLFTAHFLTLWRRNMNAATAGGGAGVPGQPGVISNKSVSKVSVGYDNQLGAVDGAGPWNLTSYGQQFIWLVQMMGVGGQQITGPFLPQGAYGWTYGPYGPFLFERDTNSL
jgi:hypothetical protein